ncbi:hypothetical protein D3C85_1589040 [compost metagenome]
MLCKKGTGLRTCKHSDVATRGEESALLGHLLGVHEHFIYTTTSLDRAGNRQVSISLDEYAAILGGLISNSLPQARGFDQLGLNQTFRLHQLWEANLQKRSQQFPVLFGFFDLRGSDRQSCISNAICLEAWV